MAARFEDLPEQLEDLKHQGLYRNRRIIESPQGVILTVDGKQIINFSSNDYLGLANHPKIITAFKQATDLYGVGSGSADLICGHNTAHQALEQELAEFTGRDRALLFSTGFMANLGVITALLQRGDGVFEDRLNHASLLDGGLMSGAHFRRYRHADLQDLENKLQARVHRKLIVSDGVFSMDGDLAPLSALVSLSKKNNAWLMIDDAHGLGVLGETGGGTLQQYGFSQQDVPVLMGTLGKSFGVFGAFVAGSDDLIETLIHKARSYIYTTALPAAIAEASRASLKILSAENWRREKLQQLLLRFRNGAEQLGMSISPSASAIQTIIIGDSKQTMTISNALLKQGFLIGAIRPPTVPKNSARLRITFSANHQPQQVDQLLEAIHSVLL